MKAISNATARTIWGTHVGGKFPRGCEWTLYYHANEDLFKYLYWQPLVLSGKHAILAGNPKGGEHA